MNRKHCSGEKIAQNIVDDAQACAKELASAEILGQRGVVTNFEAYSPAARLFD